MPFLDAGQGGEALGGLGESLGEAGGVFLRLGDLLVDLRDRGAMAFFLRGVQTGAPPSLADVQAFFEGYWGLETASRPIRFGEKDTKESLLDLATRMLEVFHKNQIPGTEIVGVEQAFDVPLIDQETGEVLDRSLVGSLDLLERDAEGRLVVVDLKTSARKYTDLQVEASLQLSVYSYATAMNGLADQEDLRLRFDVLTKTKQPELHRYWTQRDRAANEAIEWRRPGESIFPRLSPPCLPHFLKRAREVLGRDAIP